ncbi:MAG: hypothetical protein WD894_03155 [Pirellulales bacterium]
MPDQTRLQTAAKSLLDAAVGFVISHPVAVVSTVGGAVMAYLAAATTWLSAYGPIAWGGAFLAAFILIGLAWWTIGVAESRYHLNRFIKRRALTADINPLDDHFTRRRIKLIDFFHPFYRPNQAVKFQDCELFGPAVIYLRTGVTFLHSELLSCEAVIVKPNSKVVGATVFESCTFERCKIYGVTFFLSKGDYLALTTLIGTEHFKAISDGTVGDI